MNVAQASAVLQVADIDRDAIDRLLRLYGLKLVLQRDGGEISGSFWGDCEAGIVADTIHARGDTPVHSLLHETCHTICMTSDRRIGLHRDAGSGDLEEAAVCYLQIVLADCIDGVGRARMMRDMDAWGYSFRLGNTSEWFRHDADDAADFLLNHQLLNESGEATFQLRS